MTVTQTCSRYAQAPPQASWPLASVLGPEAFQGEAGGPKAMGKVLWGSSVQSTTLQMRKQDIPVKAVDFPESHSKSVAVSRFKPKTGLHGCRRPYSLGVQCKCHTAWVQNPAPSLTSWVTLGKSHLNSPSLGFLVSQVGTIIVPTP